ncbi:MAG: nitrous oxide reductase family maturation protein NosD [Promethearchaeota archaeon]
MKKIKNLILFLIILIMVLNTPYVLYSSRSQSEFDCNENSQEKNVKGAYYTPVSPITINGNSGWNTAALTEPWCSGSGTWNDPYIIEDISVDGLNTSTCISISDSTVYFIIRDSLCTNAGRELPSERGGIELYNVKNGALINNDCSNDNSRGIKIINCNNITILNNQANNNKWSGISVGGSTNNKVSGNTARNNHDGIYLSGSSIKNLVDNNVVRSNSYRGIRLTNSNNNTIFKNKASESDSGIDLTTSHFNNISENTLSYNTIYGVSLLYSNNNTIFKNTFKCNKKDIDEFSSSGNIIEENIYEPCAIPGFDLYIMIGILGIISIIIGKKLKKFK